MTILVWNATEILGYIGGLVLAVALLPQVRHTLKTRSTEDISYGWQIIYIVGLILNFVYFVLVNAPAAWVTLTLEMFFAVFLLCLKLKIDGCSGSGIKKRNTITIGDSSESSFSDGPSRQNDIEEGLPTRDESTHSQPTILHVRSNEEVNFDHPISEMRCGDVLHFHKPDAAVDESTLVCEAFCGFHIMIDAIFTDELSVDFGETIMTEICRLASLRQVRVVHRHVENFDGSTSPRGFAASALLDESHMSVHCHSDQGKLAFNVFTCGSQPDNSQMVARDVLAFLKKNLSDDTKYLLHHFPRLPKQA